MGKKRKRKKRNFSKKIIFDLIRKNENELSSRFKRYWRFHEWVQRHPKKNKFPTQRETKTENKENEFDKGRCWRKKKKFNFLILKEFIQNVPGTQKICVKTFGCSHNMSDSEFMMGQLSEFGYTLVDSFNEADLILINSCTVKNPSQDAFIG